MEINATHHKKVTENPEGSIVLDRIPEIQLYLEASNLKIKEDSFYTSAEGKLKSVIESANTLSPEYVLGLAQYLADKGLKLSPVVLLSVLAERNMSFREVPVHHIFNTPQRIAESIGLQNLNLLKLNNSFKKHVLRSALEKMSPFTLKKNKMKHRKIKLRDLIKLLRPKPNSPELASLYKALIENSKEASLKDTETLISLKSSKMESSMKKEELIKIVETASINQLIRNLKYYAEQLNFEESVDVQRKVIARLQAVKDYRFFNIFDLIDASFHVPVFQKALFEVIQKFIAEVKSKFTFDKAHVLFDVSGSMGGALPVGIKYLILMRLLYDSLDVHFFADNLIDTRAVDFAHTKLGDFSSMKEYVEQVYSRHQGGTALVGSAMQLLKEKPELSTLIVISDEVSWVEGQDLRYHIQELQDTMKGRKLILINPAVYQGTVFSQNTIGIASLTSAILSDLALLTDPQKFIKYIKDYSHNSTDHAYIEH